MKNDEFCKSLESAFRIKRQRAAELASEKEQSLARLRARIQERIKSGDLPEEPDISCHMVRPFLPQVADPLELTATPAWLEEHLVICEDCRGELERLEEVRHAITVSEMPPLEREAIVDTPSGLLKKVYDLRAIPPEKITCDLTEAYYPDMAACDLAVPAEIYRHARFCTSCRQRVQDLRSALGVSIPQAGSAEFDELLAGKSIPGLEPAATKIQPRVPSRVGIFLQRNWRKVAAASIAAVLIIGFLVMPERAMAVTFAQVCQAFGKISFVRIVMPREEMWCAKDPLVQIRIRKDGSYRRFTASSGEFVRYGPEGELQMSKEYSGQKLQELVGNFQRDLDFRQNLGLPIDAKIEWSVIQQNITVDGKLTDVYELTKQVGKLGDTELEKFKIFVDQATCLPVQWEKYRQDWETKAWSLTRTARFTYPDQIPEEILNPKFPIGG